MSLLPLRIEENKMNLRSFEPPIKAILCEPSPMDEFGVRIYGINFPCHICEDCGFAENIQKVTRGNAGFYIGCPRCKGVTRLQSGFEDKWIRYLKPELRPNMLAASVLDTLFGDLQNDVAPKN